MTWAGLPRPGTSSAQHHSESGHITGLCHCRAIMTRVGKLGNIVIDIHSLILWFVGVKYGASATLIMIMTHHITIQQILHVE